MTASEIHWMEGEKDLCCHGKLTLQIGDRTLSTENDGDWSLAWASMNLLLAVVEDCTESRFRDPDLNQLVPCCGFLFAADGDRLITNSCNRGIDWVIRHQGSSVVHVFDDGTSQRTTRSEWAGAVVKFSEEVIGFYGRSTQRTPSPEEAASFTLFARTWRDRYARAVEVSGGQSLWTERTDGKL